MNKIYWLASYPKSGNTWFRIFLSNLLHPESAPVDINALPESHSIASARATFDEITGLPSSDLEPDEVERMRPRVYEQLSEEAERRIYLKVHDAYTHTSSGEPLIPTSVTEGALYFVRNPLDIVGSFAHHSQTGLDETIERMANANDVLGGGGLRYRLEHQLRQRLLGWSGHVESWMRGAPFPVHLMRYEEMLAQPVPIFHQAVQFLGLDLPAGAVEKALDHCAFDRLREFERTARFKETPRKSSHFFRSGRADTWKEELSPEQVERIVADHGAVMEWVGYGVPVPGGAI